MELYLVPNNPERTLLVSPNLVAHYQIDTLHATTSSCVTVIRRLGVSIEDSLVAEIQWKNRYKPTFIRSPLIAGTEQCIGVKGIGIKGLHFLYKGRTFGSTRYFIGDDALEYRWKMIRGIGCTLTRADSRSEIASSQSFLCTDGPFAGEKKYVLRIQPCSVDVELILLTFIIMERKRRQRDGFGGDLYTTPHDVDPQGDGLGDADGGSGEMGDTGGELGLVGEL